MARDPVCGMEVDPDSAVETAEFRGKEYAFCSSACAEQFEQDPERFVGQSGQQNPKRGAA